MINKKIQQLKLSKIAIPCNDRPYILGLHHMALDDHKQPSQPVQCKQKY